mgnify:CR=1 FL=1
MLRTLDFILIAAMIAAASITYQIKHSAEEKLEEVKRLQASITQEEITIDLLNADWSLLNQPGRLEKLTKEFAERLQLDSITPTQMAEQSEVPGFAADFEPKLAEGETQPDKNIQTGSVKP